MTSATKLEERLDSRAEQNIILIIVKFVDQGSVVNRVDVSRYRASFRCAKHGISRIDTNLRLQ